MIDTTSFEKWF